MKQLQVLKGRFTYLFYALLFVLIIYPYLGRGPAGIRILTLLTSLIPLAGVYAASYNKFQLQVAIWLGVPFFVFSWTQAFLENNTIFVLNNVFAILFYAYTIVILLIHILKSRKVTSEMIYGSLTVYLLLGFLWAVLYNFINFLFPGSFSAGVQLPDLFYYSFLTLTTLGYGDIIPLTAQAQSLSFLEAIAGVLYLTVLLARLVAAYTARKH